MQVIDPLTCGFVKVLCYNLFTQTKNNTSQTPGNPKHNQSVVLKEKYDPFLKTFPRETHGIVEYCTFVNIFKKIVTNMQSLGKKFPEKKKHLLEVFSIENWHNSNDRKTPHKIFDCQACLKSCKWNDALVVFPTKNPNNKTKAKQNGLIERSILKDRTREIFNKLNQEFRTEYNTTIIKQVKDYLKVHKPSAIVRLAKKDIENQLEDTCVERYVVNAIIVISFSIKFHYYQILR